MNEMGGGGQGLTVRLRLTTHLACSLDEAWQQVRTSRLLEYVTSPLQVFEPVQPQVLPETWAAGSYLVKLKLFGLFPMGSHTIVISFPTDSAPASRTRQILDNGRGSLASSWKHLITVSQTSDATVVYTDEVEIRAGWLTLAVWLYAQAFYRYRQYRWRRLVRRDFNYE